MANSDQRLLSVRQRAVLQLICAGKSNKEIAANQDISVKTVEFHVANLFRTLACTSRVELAILVLRGNRETDASNNAFDWGYP